jgi:hypothetical protein
MLGRGWGVSLGHSRATSYGPPLAHVPVSPSCTIENTISPMPPTSSASPTANRTA